MALIGSDYTQLKQGEPAPDFSLIGTDEKTYSLHELKGEKATLIVFICNHCPYVKPKIAELIRIAKDFKEPGLRVFGINSNDAERYPDDSFENMKKAVQDYGINFHYLYDETQEVARKYGAVCTPDPFLFDKDLKLIFHSRIDDTHGTEQPTKHELYETIQEFLKAGKIIQKEQPSVGCSIKWKFD